MTPIIRFVLSVLNAIFASRIDVDAISKVRMRVLPNDLDINLHMNNARYLALCDIVPRAWRLLIGGRIIRFRFGLRPFEPFTVLTQILCWDDKWFYFEQRMETKRGVAAIILSKGLVRNTSLGITIPPNEIIQSIGSSRRTSGITPEVAQWLATEELLHIEERV
jgi:hypothetical protein